MLPWGWELRSLWSICQDLLLNGLVVWASSKLYLRGSVIKHQQALQAGAGGAIWCLHGAQYSSPHTLHSILGSLKETQLRHSWPHKFYHVQTGELVPQCHTLPPAAPKTWLTHTSFQAHSPSKDITCTASQSPSDLSTHTCVTTCLDTLLPIETSS